MKALAKSREERPQTALEFRRALDSLNTADVAAWGEDEAASWWAAHATPPTGQHVDPAAAPTVDQVSAGRPADAVPSDAPTLEIDLSKRNGPSV